MKFPIDSKRLPSDSDWKRTCLQFQAVPIVTFQELYLEMKMIGGHQPCICEMTMMRRLQRQNVGSGQKDQTLGPSRRYKRHAIYVLGPAQINW